MPLVRGWGLPWLGVVVFLGVGVLVGGGSLLFGSTVCGGGGARALLGRVGSLVLLTLPICVVDHAVVCAGVLVAPVVSPVGTPGVHSVLAVFCGKVRV